MDSKTKSLTILEGSYKVLLFDFRLTSTQIAPPINNLKIYFLFFFSKVEIAREI